MKSVFLKVILIALALGFFVAAQSLASHSFRQIQDMRQLERVPQTQVLNSLPGVVNISANVSTAGNLLVSKLTQTSSVYYRYRHEIETTDSEGNTRWSTKEDWHL